MKSSIYLVDDENFMVDLLRAEETVHVRHKLLKLFEPVAEGDNDGKSVPQTIKSASFQLLRWWAMTRICNKREGQSSIFFQQNGRLTRGIWQRYHTEK